jgi:anthranilate phosphoribosyltransferase
VLEKLIPQLAAAQPLATGQIHLAVKQLADEKIPANLKADFLAALAQKGETPGEIAAFARALRDKSIAPPLDAETRSREILDVVGTGGDRLGTFNISTAAAIVCAAAGVTVAKHGNRAVTSQAGSADVLEALGIRIDLTPAEAARSLREHNFAFFFAPNYHPAFKHISPARNICAARGQRTIFNLLGPLLNPARPSAMLMGVPQPELCEPLAQVLQSLGVRRAMVVCGKIGNRKPETGNFLDELSTLGENTIAEFYQERGFTVSTTLPDQFPLQPATLADLLGGDKMANAKIVREILSGEERGPKRDAVLLNAAAALFVAGKTKSLAEGWDLAGGTIDSGKAKAKLSELAHG